MTFIKLEKKSDILDGKYGRSFEQLTPDERCTYFRKAYNVLKLHKHPLVEAVGIGTKHIYHDEFFIYSNPTGIKDSVLAIPVDLARYAMVNKVTNDLWSFHKSKNVDPTSAEMTQSRLYGLLHILRRACGELGIEIPVYIYNYKTKSYYTPILVGEKVEVLTEDRDYDRIKDDDDMIHYEFGKTDIRNLYKFISNETLSMVELKEIAGLMTLSKWLMGTIRVVNRKLLSEASTGKENQLAITIARELYGIDQ